MRSSKLEKLKMPEKKPMDLEDLKDQGADEDTEDMPDAEGSPEEEANESPEEEAQEGPNPELEKVSDDDLMAEIKKRGLMQKLEDDGSEQDMGDEDKYAPPPSRMS